MSEEEVHATELADTMVQLDIAWERRKARLALGAISVAYSATDPSGVSCSCRSLG